MKPFLSKTNAIIQIYSSTILKNALREEFCRDFVPLEKTFCFFARSQQNVKKN